MSLKTIRKDVKRWWSIQKTIRELNHLGDHELNDLGISRWRIPEIAKRNVRH